MIYFPFSLIAKEICPFFFLFVVLFPSRTWNLMLILCWVIGVLVLHTIQYLRVGDVTWWMMINLSSRSIEELKKKKKRIPDSERQRERVKSPSEEQEEIAAITITIRLIKAAAEAAAAELSIGPPVKMRVLIQVKIKLSIEIQSEGTHTALWRRRDVMDDDQSVIKIDRRIEEEEEDTW